MLMNTVEQDRTVSVSELLALFIHCISKLSLSASFLQDLAVPSIEPIPTVDVRAEGRIGEVDVFV